MAPECIFIAAMAVAALCMPFNRMAVVVVLSWLGGQYAWMLGLPSMGVDLIANALATVIAFEIAWHNPSKSHAVVTALFPLFVALYGAELIGELSPYHVWWIGFYIGMTQCILLPFGNDWEKAKRMFHRFDEWLMQKIVKHFGEAL